MLNIQFLTDTFIVFIALQDSSPKAKPLAAQGFASHTGVLAAEGKAVGNHGDEFTIGGLALARLRLADGAVP